jgi:hypothetical protein
MTIMIKWGKNSAYVLNFGRNLPWCQSIHLIYLFREYYAEDMSIVHADYIFGWFREKKA